MSTNGLRDVLLKHSDDLKNIGATALYIFGSRAKGFARNDSDVDLFIDYESAKRIPSMLKLIEFERVVGEEIGIPIHITTRRSLHPKMKMEIEQTAIRIF